MDLSNTFPKNPLDLFFLPFIAKISFYVVFIKYCTLNPNVAIFFKYIFFVLFMISHFYPTYCYRNANIAENRKMHVFKNRGLS